MGDMCDPSKCSKLCSSHEAQVQLTRSLEKEAEKTKADLSELEELHNTTVQKLSAIDGRLTVFTWITGVLLVMMVSFSIYGIVQLQAFKETYYRDMLQLQSSLRSQNK